MNYTENYQLNQWEETDRVLMDDFNADNQRIEAALAAKCEMVFGQYTGDGMESRFIPLGFTPSLVVVTNQVGTMVEGSYVYGGIAMTNADGSGVEIAENGFIVKNQGTYICCNYADTQYNIHRQYIYIAIK